MKPYAALFMVLGSPGGVEIQSPTRTGPRPGLRQTAALPAARPPLGIFFILFPFSTFLTLRVCMERAR